MIKKCLLFAFLFLVVFSAKSQSAFDKMLCDFVTTDPTFCNDSTPTPLILDESLFFPDSIVLFYREAQCKAVWFDGTTLTDAGHQIISIISDAPAQGLDARYYHTALLNKLDNLLIAYLSAHQDEMLAYEILLTDAAYKYARDVRFGCINPANLPFRWEISRDNPFLIKPFVEAVNNNTITAFFEKLAPTTKDYDVLKNNLAYYRELLQNTPEEIILPKELKLAVGDSSEWVPELRKRLAQLQYYTLDYPDKDDSTQYIYNGILAEQLAVFQRAFGLTADSVVGEQTIKKLNITFADKIKIIKINMERWRWLPRNFYGRHVLVNIANFTMYMLEDNKLIFEKRVCVGKPFSQTPVFSDQIEYLEFNPYWTVPYSIASNEILPKLRKNAYYLESQNMELLSGGKTVNPQNIDWSVVSARNFRYTVRQKPGNNNALGVVKFLFPNEYDVYLHDTPSKSLFSKDSRAFSHGCVRVEKPLELAEYLLQDTKWDLEKIAQTIDKGKNTRVSLEKPIPIDLLYFTAWVNEEGALIFQEDIYKRDPVIINALPGINKN